MLKRQSSKPLLREGSLVKRLPSSAVSSVPVWPVVTRLAPIGHQEPLAGPQERESPAMATGLSSTFYLQN